VENGTIMPGTEGAPQRGGPAEDTLLGVLRSILGISQ
jgi:hypothetical protein